MTNTRGLAARQTDVTTRAKIAMVAEARTRRKIRRIDRTVVKIAATITIDAIIVIFFRVCGRGGV